jgi:large subunit ribosomal protein L9
MKVIFIQDVANVAKAGQLKEVANGYARNFLLPRKLAVVATATEMKKMETHNYAAAQRQERSDSDLSALADEIEKLTLNLQLKVGVNNRVYGSITASHIADELAKLTGHEIDKKKVELEDPIKKLGDYEVSIHFAKDIIAKVRLSVGPKE